MRCVDGGDEYEDEDEFLDEFEDDDGDYEFHGGELHGAAGLAPTAPGWQQQHDQAYGPDDTVADEDDEEDEYEDYQDAEELHHELLAGGEQGYRMCTNPSFWSLNT